MIYEDDEQKNSHVSYKEYKQQINEDKKPNENLVLFISAFFVMVLVFLGIAKQLSPDVDVNIDTNNEKEEYSQIDDSLKTIQQEDKNLITKDGIFASEFDEKVVLPKKKQNLDEENIQKSDKDFEKNIEKTEVRQQPSQQSAAPQPISISTPQSAKVVVGHYSTPQQAEVAKDIIQEAGFQPFVKNIDGYYTLQIGSFASREKAQSVANELLKKNFPAKIINE